MTPGSTLAADLARSGRVIVLAALLGTAVGALYGATRPVRYSAGSTFLMSGMALGREGMKRMPVSGPEMQQLLDAGVLAKAETRLSLPAGALAESSIDATAVTEAGLYRVTVVSDDPDRARNAANVIADVMVDKLNDLRQRRVKQALDHKGREEPASFASAEGHLLDEMGSSRLEMAESAFQKVPTVENARRLAAVRQRLAELRLNYDRALEEVQRLRDAETRAEAEAWLAEPSARGYEPSAAAVRQPRSVARAAAAGAASGASVALGLIALFGLPRRRAAVVAPEPSPT